MSPRVSWLDVKLGVRMLVKHPALTIIGGFGLALGIAISLTFFSVMASLVYPTLPLSEGERIVALENRDAEVNDEERRALHDFFAWRDELESVEELAAFRTVPRNLVEDGGVPEAVHVAEMTAAGFRVARVAPLMGRYLLEEDERPGAPPVLVIGYDAWRGRFAGDPAIVGRSIRLGATAHTVVGVMPEDFTFPLSHHYWTPLRARPDDFPRREGPAIHIFGRLAPGVTMEEAQAELDVIGTRAAAAYPETHAQLRPQVMPYTWSLNDIQGGIPLWSLAQLQLMITLLLVVVALNVGVLVYARTATRHGEIAVRSALGASRRRIVGQLFLEALVLALASAAVGFALAQGGIRVALRLMEMDMGIGEPFWQDYGLRPAAVFFTIGLAVLAAVIIGVVPALQATGRRLQSDLKRLGGITGPGLGRTWTALIVAQVAIAVALLPGAASLGWYALRGAASVATYPAEEFLSASVSWDEEGTAGSGEERAAGSREEGTPAGARLTELLDRLEADPRVVGVTYRTRLRGRTDRVQVEGPLAVAPAPGGHAVSSRGVDPGFFDVYGLRVRAGRGFEPRDLGEGADVVLVDEGFVRKVLGGAGAVGRRVRHVIPGEGPAAADTARWYEIVGVVGSLQANQADPTLVGGTVYYPVTPARAEGVTLAVRLRGATPADFAPELRRLTAAVDPTLRLGEVASMDEAIRRNTLVSRGLAAAFGLILVSVFLLSAAGIYALMSFIVTRRRKEIGIRSALGAHPAQLLRSVFRRAAGQVGLGVLIGAALAVLLESVTGGALMSGRGAVILPAIAVAMALVGVLAALGPARRGLGIQPTEALRSEG